MPTYIEVVGVTDVEERRIEVPEGVNVSINGGIVEVSGPLGSLRKDFSHAKVEILMKDNIIIIRKICKKKWDRAVVGTIASKIKNMIIGVTRGFVYRLKMVWSHFPMDIKVVSDEVIIENFIGEKAPRRAKIMSGVLVEKVGENEIVVSGIDLDAVSQTAANIQLATKIKGKDPRKFLDGIYIYSKGEHMR